MEKLKVNFENCFGIEKLENHEFDFTKSNVNLIYAKNGSMKTSFAKIFEKYQNGKQKEIKDYIFEEPEIHLIESVELDIKGGQTKNIKGKIKAVNKKNKNIFVISGFDEEYQSKNISNLLLNPSLKQLLEKVLELRNNIFEVLISKTNLKYTKTDAELENTIIEVFSFEKKSFLQNLDKLEIKDYGYDDIIYQNIFFNEDYIITKDFQENIKDFIDKQNEISNDYDFLKNSNLNFFGLKSIGEILEKENFFNDNKTNKIILEGYPEIKEKEKIIGKDGIIEEIEKKLIASIEFKKLSSKLKTSNGKKLLQILQKRPEIINKLKEKSIDNFKKEIFSSYFFELKDELKKLKEEFKKLKTKLPKDLKKSKWEEAKNIFNRRFSMPFKMEIGNLEDSIFGASIPLIEFHFCNKENFDDCSDNEIEKKNKDSIISTLSQGEKRALYLLNIIFDIENLKKEIEANPEMEVLFIIDDIADSFDYKNKYAIVEYLQEIQDFQFKINPFYLIILTHNFDFFRFVRKRLGIEKKEVCFEIQKELNGKINLIKSEEKEPWEIWKKNLNEKNVIALIPFVRNLIEYGLNNREEYLTLTHLLHDKKSIKYKLNSENEEQEVKENEDFIINEIEKITFNEIESIYKKYLIEENFNIKDKNKKIFKSIEDISKDIDNSSLENKIILSIYIRILAERHLKKEIPKMNKSVKFDKINEYGNLFKKYKEIFNNNLNPQKQEERKDEIKILNSVNIMTPENIHLNSFMYEPILDMDIVELKKLYDEVKGLN